MPSVPRLNGTVQQAALPNARVTTDAPVEAFGGGASFQRTNVALQETANTVTKFIEQEQDKAAQIEALEADAKVSAIKTSLVYDPQNGAMTKKGKDAFGAIGTYNEEFAKKTADIENSLTSQRAKNLFKQRLVGHRRELNEHLQKNAFIEGEKYDTEVTEASLATYRNEATLNFQDPGYIQKSIAEQEAVLNQYAQRNGKSPEWLTQKLADNRSKTHIAVIDRMTSNGDDRIASQYFASVKGEIAGDDIAKVEKVLEQGSLVGESQRRSDMIMSSGRSLSQSLDMARQIEDPKLRDATVARVKDEFNLKRAAQEDAQRQLFEKAGDIVEQSRGNLNLITPQMRVGMSVAENNAIDARARQLREGVQPSTNWQSYYDLKTLASTDAGRGSFLKMNLYEYRPEMADPEFKELVNLQTQMRNGQNPDELNEFRTKTQIANDALNAAGIDPTPKDGTNDAKKVELFRRQVDERYAEIAKGGVKPTGEQVQKIVDDLLIEGSVSRKYWFDQNKRAFELSEDESFNVDFDAIPKKERIAIEARLRANKIPITNEAIQMVYSRRFSRGQ